MTRKSYLIAVGLTLLVLGVIVLYVFEFKQLNRTLHARTLVIVSVLTGVLAGIGLGYYLRDRAKNALEKVQIFVASVILCALFMPLLGSLSNRLLSGRALKLTPVELAEVTARYADRFGAIEGEKPEANQYYLFFYKDGELHRIETDSPVYTDRARGDTIYLPIKKGLWGFEWVGPLGRSVE